jgi:hypothetical protein
MNKNNYSPFITNKTKNIQENKNEKIKFMKNSNRAFNQPDCDNFDSPIDVESYLRNSYTQSKNKTSIELNTKLSPNNFSVGYQNNLNVKSINNKVENGIYINKDVKPRYINDKPYTGPGKGIGNLDISDNVRFGLDTRRYNDEFRNINEGSILDRFDILDKNVQNPNNIVLPFPQGGVQTRNNKKLVKNCNTKFDFTYN